MKGPQSYTQQVSGRLGAAACGLTSDQLLMPTPEEHVQAVNMKLASASA
jgi:hypothetical protein